MNKKDFYKAQGKLEAGKELTHIEQTELISFAEMLYDMMDELQSDEGDVWGTEGLDHAIGWD